MKLFWILINDYRESIMDVALETATNKFLFEAQVNTSSVWVILSLAPSQFINRDLRIRHASTVLPPLATR